MQVANDVTSANKLPSREARVGRRVFNSAAAGNRGRSGAWSRWPRARRSWRMRPCCAGQRRRHAEHHGRLLLHGGH